MYNRRTVLGWLAGAPLIGAVLRKCKKPSLGDIARDHGPALRKAATTGHVPMAFNPITVALQADLRHLGQHHRAGEVLVLPASQAARLIKAGAARHYRPPGA